MLADKEAEGLILRALEPYGMKVLSEEAGMTGDPKGGDPGGCRSPGRLFQFREGNPLLLHLGSHSRREGGSKISPSESSETSFQRGRLHGEAREKGQSREWQAHQHELESTRAGEAVVGIDISRSSPQLVSRLAKLASGVKRQTHYGANALELCYVADEEDRRLRRREGEDRGSRISPRPT